MNQDAETRGQGRTGAADRLRHAIDSGRIGDKVPGFDPAAAPLGTDEESSGYGLPNVGAHLPAPGVQTPSDMAADPAGTDRARYRLQDRIVLPAIGGLILVAAAVALVWVLVG